MWVDRIWELESAHRGGNGHLAGASIVVRFSAIVDFNKGSYIDKYLSVN